MPSSQMQPTVAPRRRDTIIYSQPMNPNSCMHCLCEEDERRHRVSRRTRTVCAAQVSAVSREDSCHLLHGQKVREAPRKLQHLIPGLQHVELPCSEICCGSAWVYNVTQTETSLDLPAEKMRHAQATHAQVIATSNPAACCKCGLARKNPQHQSARHARHRVARPCARILRYSKPNLAPRR